MFFCCWYVVNANRVSSSLCSRLSKHAQCSCLVFSLLYTALLNLRFLYSVLFNKLNVFAQVSCICSFCGITNHGAEALFRILYVGLVVTPNSIAKTFVAERIRKFPLLFFCNIFDDVHHIVVESLLLPRLTLICRQLIVFGHVLLQHVLQGRIVSLN